MLACRVEERLAHESLHERVEAEALEAAVAERRSLRAGRLRTFGRGRVPELHHRRVELHRRRFSPPHQQVVEPHLQRLQLTRLEHLLARQHNKATLIEQRPLLGADAVRSTVMRRGKRLRCLRCTRPLVQLGTTPSNTEDHAADYLLATPIEQYQGDEAEAAGRGGAHAGRRTWGKMRGDWPNIAVSGWASSAANAPAAPPRSADLLQLSVAPESECAAHAGIRSTVHGVLGLNPSLLSQ
jgi:hypothetical protein